MPWEPTGVCLWGRRGQVWGHTSSVSAERRVDHTNSIMATNTAIMRPQISTTKMPPMFSMPRPGSGPQETNISTRLFFFSDLLAMESTSQPVKTLCKVFRGSAGALLEKYFNILGKVFVCCLVEG